MNRLRFETSPYLLQHAHNPVDWYAWKPEAFERARAEQKPILVSIGYSTCHWCHVMERESFEQEDIAAFMNERFICIKVDREERPDVDAIYMEACQLVTGSGGWPLNCFLTPDGKPFYAGTYYPPRPAYNRPSWLQLLQHLSDIWDNKRSEALDQAARLLQHIRSNDNTLVAGPGQPSGKSLGDVVFAKMYPQFDQQDGGFGGAPKFPSTMAIRFLLNYYHFTGNKAAADQALLSLDKMIYGGIYDQLGGGFARYSTDSEWLVPHFEKMLYDNALLVIALSDAFRLTGKELYRETIEETLEYVRREMTHPDGGFYAAQDADSEGEEGRYFVWSHAEVAAVLGSDAELFSTFYDVTPQGNWEGKNILRRLAGYADFAKDMQADEAWLTENLRVAREKLFAVRDKRVHPGLDHKIILGWNALMVSAYAAAFSAIGREEYRLAAIRHLDFLLERFFPQTNGSEAAWHVWTDGQGQYPAFLEDYAYLIAALTDVYQICFDGKYLRAAAKYTRLVLSYFEDKETGLFYMTRADQTDIALRKKDLYDNATPSGNSVMVHNLQRLSILLDLPDWREQAGKMIRAMRQTVEKYPLSFENWVTAMMQEEYPLIEIAVIGENAELKALQLQRLFVPHQVMAASRKPSENWPLLAGKAGGEDALIYVCRDYACQRPVVTLAEFEELLGY
jgi:hypothetical protein